MSAATLNPGEKLQGKNRFDVPNTDVMIVYAPGFESRALGQWIAKE